MKLAYLTNRYPKTSHSFVRREIRALEEAGADVLRVSVRAPEADLVDERDRAEAERTHVLLAEGIPGLAAATLGRALRGPTSFLATLLRAVRLGLRSDRGVLRHLAYLVEACALLRLARRFERDHVHAHFGTNPAMVALLARALGGPTYSFTVHGPEEFDRPGPLRLGEKIADALFVVAISSYGRSQLYRWSAPGDWHKVQVVHCGVDDLFLAEEPRPPSGERLLVCVGRLCEQKGQLLLLEAVARLAASGVAFQLVLAGDGEMRGAIEARARELGIEDRLRITGWVDNEEVRRLVVAARALVLPSFAEGLPVVLMEALALGRPVVSTYVAGIPELVTCGGEDACGWLVPAGDVGALADAIDEALSAPEETLERMGRNGAQRVRERHDAAREAKKLVELFPGVV